MAPAAGEDRFVDHLAISELRVGAVDHDSGLLGRNKEPGFDVTVELRFQPLKGRFWDEILRPRPHIGANLSTEGATNSVYTGLTWTWRFVDRYFLSIDLGGGVHDGKTTLPDPGRKELGTRLLFREAIEFGVDLDGQFALSLRADHMSNANIGEENEGLDTAGVIYTIRF